MEFEYCSHKEDVLSDYMFFGKIYRWSPESIDEMRWSDRKQLKQAYIDSANERK